MRRPIPADTYTGYADLARRQVEGVDYAVHVRAPLNSRFAILAPHGGRIEGGTSEVARMIAGEEHGLYLFEGLRLTADNFEHLHLTSHCFDEPRCLALLAGCDTAVAIHGYASHGADALLGGRDDSLKAMLASQLTLAGVSVKTEGHSFPGLDPLNVCNRTRRGRGVQIELSDQFRRRRDWAGLVAAVRVVLSAH